MFFSKEIRELLACLDVHSVSCTRGPFVYVSRTKNKIMIDRAGAAVLVQNGQFFVDRSRGIGKGKCNDGKGRDFV